MPANWTWFELHFPGSETKGSLWSWLNTDGTSHQLATFRTSQGTVLSPFALIEDPERRWISPATNVTHPTAWTLEFPSGDCLKIASMRGDQEIGGMGAALALATYEGFATGNGTLFGEPVELFGLVEVNPTL
jgi:kievitone hydratase